MRSSHDTLGDLWFGESALNEQDALYRQLCRGVPRAQAAIICPPSVSREQERERVIDALIQINRLQRLLSTWSQDLAAWIDLPNPSQPSERGAVASLCPLSGAEGVVGSVRGSVDPTQPASRR